jgi:IS30 family transposase
MPKGHHHLTYEQRCQIYALLKSGRTKAGVARQIGVHRSTITREIERNTGRKGYRYKQAQEKASARRAAASSVPRKMTPSLIREIEEKLTREQWSPEQIGGWLKKEGRRFVSPERIYRHIWKEQAKRGKSLAPPAPQRQEVQQAQRQELRARPDPWPRGHL